MQADQLRPVADRHPAAVAEVHARLLETASVQQRFVELPHGRRHVIESGSGHPLVLLHGSGPSAVLFLPLLERLRSVRALAVNRAGWGLSDAAERPASATYRDFCVGELEAVVDALQLNDLSILGSSMGGTIATWYALRHPQRVRRLILVGAPPTLPGTNVPPPMLGVGSARRNPQPPPPEPSAESVIKGMAMMGEADSIVDHPPLIEAELAIARDPVASIASSAEFAAIIGETGWQPAVELRPAELDQLAPPTLLIWGSRDPLGGTDGAAQLAGRIPQATLEVLDAGHAPWLGHPDRVAALVRDFVA